MSWWEGVTQRQTIAKITDDCYVNLFEIAAVESESPAVGRVLERTRLTLKSGVQIKVELPLNEVLEVIASANRQQKESDDGPSRFPKPNSWRPDW